MTISVVQQSTVTVQTATSTTISCTLPSTPTTGNLLVWFQSSDKSPTSFTVPTGFTSRAEVVAASISILIATKISDGTEGGAITCTIGTARRSKACVFEMMASGGGTIGYDSFAVSNTETNVTALMSGNLSTGSDATYGLTLLGKDSAKAVYSDPDPTTDWDTETNCSIAPHTRDWSATSGNGETGFDIGFGTVVASATATVRFTHTDSADAMAIGFISMSETGGYTGETRGIYYHAQQ